MKNRGICKIGIFLGICLLFIANIHTQSVYASDVTLTGISTGLRITYDNPMSVRNIFNLDHMLPGDRHTAKITIKNTDINPFTLNVTVKNIKVPDGSIDLLEALQISATSNGVALEGFPKKTGTYTFPNRFNLGSTTTLEITVLLPGETGNRYQLSTASLEWIFTAVSVPGGNENSGGGVGNIGGGGEIYDVINLPLETIPIKNPKPPINKELPNNQPTTIDDNSLPIGQNDEPSLDLNDTPMPGLDDVLPEETPSGVLEMPKTGEASLWYFYIGGSLSILTGLLLLRKKTKV